MDDRWTVCKLNNTEVDKWKSQSMKSFNFKGKPNLSTEQITNMIF